jgi:hypothetical protein
MEPVLIASYAEMLKAHPTGCSVDRILEDPAYRDAIARCRELEMLDAPPESLPAELRHRCFGFSLAPVCIPEETLYQLGNPPAPTQDLKPAPELKRVIPQPDDGAVLYLQEPGSFDGNRSEHLVIKKEGKELIRASAWISSPVSLSTASPPWPN